MLRGRGLGRIYGAKIAVAEREGRPLRFTWQGRVHGVRRIIDHWVMLRTDWAPQQHERIPERRYWRVEAGAEGFLGVYELRHDATSGDWTLARLRD